MAALDLDLVQGNILRGYKLPLVRHLLLEVTDRARARRFLAAAAAEDAPAPQGAGSPPRITRASDFDKGLQVRFNIGLTFEGLKALGLQGLHLESFPLDFQQGMPRRAAKLIDIGESAPENWYAPFRQPERLHVVATIYAAEPAGLDALQAECVKAFHLLGRFDGRNRKDGTVHFGYVDGISQPRFEGIHDPDMEGDNEPFDPLGTVLLGHPTHFEGLAFAVPSPPVLGANGAFNAFRVLKQDVAAFEAFLDRAADVLIAHPDGPRLLKPGTEEKVVASRDRRAALREVVAAQMLGRWRNGRPYALSPDAQLPDPDLNVRPPLTNYDYGRDSRCPAGAHMRRANPRGGKIVQRVSNRTRRLVRRGVPYDLAAGEAGQAAPEQGLLGNFIGASISGQFEAVMCDWMNLGLQDPDISGTNDPLLGANDPATSAFDLTLEGGGSLRLTGLPRFVITRGGAYTFLPSLPAIRHLGGLGG